jgi:hypothetical protein
MVRFRVHYLVSSGSTSSVDVVAASFLKAGQVARQQAPFAQLRLIEMLDATGEVEHVCAECGVLSVVHLTWAGGNVVVVPCAGCDQSLRIHRVRRIREQRAGIEGQVRVDGPAGPSAETVDHLRAPSISDKVRAKFFNAGAVEWKCLRCRWTICCDWSARKTIQTCPECGTRQYVPAWAYAWNSRIMHALEVNRKADEQNASDLALAAANARKREEERRLAAAEAQRAAAERNRQIALNRLAELTIGSGIVANRGEFDGLSPAILAEISQLERLADELQSDFVAALGDNALAEKGVAIGRPVATGAGIASLLNGYGWAGIAFGALALGARWMANDWKRAKAAEFQAKWAGNMSGFNRLQLEAFSRIVSFKYPALSQLAVGHGQLPP